MRVRKYRCDWCGDNKEGHPFVKHEDSFLCSSKCFESFIERIPIIKMGERKEVQSPCIGVCRISEDEDFLGEELCRGCLRTIEEIRRWPHMSDGEKIFNLSEIGERKRHKENLESK